MAQSFDLTSKVHVFRCPKCNEFVNLTMESCPFCSAAIDSVSAQRAASDQDQINQAVNNSSYIRILAGTIAVFYGVSFVPLIGTPGTWGFLFLIVAVPILIVRFWVKYSKIQSADPAVRKAKRSVLAALGIWIVMIVVWLVVSTVIQIASR